MNIDPEIYNQYFNTPMNDESRRKFINNLSFEQYIELICISLNKSGYKRKTYKLGNGEYQLDNYEPFEDVIIVDVVRDSKALNFLKKVKLLDLGRCPECGSPTNNQYKFTSGLNPQSSYYICKKCYNEKTSLQKAFMPKRNNGCMLILFFIIIFFSGVFLSCKQQSSKIPEQEIITEDNKNKPLPEGYLWGKKEPYVGKNRIEKNILSQFESYTKSLLRRDINGASCYLYPDAISYFRKYYPDTFTDKDIINEFYKALSEDFIKLYQSYEALGMNIDFIISNIDRIFKVEDAVLCVFSMTIQTYYAQAKGEKYFHTTPTEDDQTVGVSFNQGKNWYFLALNGDTPNILRLNFTNETISQIMGY